MLREPSDKLVRACALFGITPDHAARSRRGLLASCGAAALRIDRSLLPGQIALITGASGGGKSTIVSLLARRLRARRERVLMIDPRQLFRSRAPLIDRFHGSPEAALGALALA